MKNIKVAGALFDFAAYLTTLKDPVTFGAEHEAGPAVELLTAFAQRRGLETKDADVLHWNEEGIKPALDVIRKALEDKSYYIGWQANIAMAFKDEFSRTIGDEFDAQFGPDHANTIHLIANQAADNFLDLLMREPG